MSQSEEFEQLNLDLVRPLESTEEYKERAALFAELWYWIEKHVYNILKHKGWTTKERRDAELVFSIVASLIGIVQALRKGNPMSKECPGVSLAEQKIADVLIGIQDLSFSKKWDVPKAMLLRMESLKKKKFKLNSRRPV